MKRRYPLVGVLLAAVLGVSGCYEDSTADGDASVVSDGMLPADQGSAVGDAHHVDSAVDAQSMTPTDVGIPSVDVGIPTIDVGVPLDSAMAQSGDGGTGSLGDAAMNAADAWIDEGNVATSCGVEGQGLIPVDCTSEGDDAARCVFGNHCKCSEGFECESETMWPGTNECDPGSICVPVAPVRVGSEPTSCGAPDQGLEPVDCTVNGDADAGCVFSNHCNCSEGFVCEMSGDAGECAPGESCVPAP